MVLEPTGTIARAAGVVAGLICVVHTLLKNRASVPLGLRFGVTFVVWAWLSLFWTIHVEYTLVRAFTYTQLWLVCWAIYQHAEDAKMLLGAYVAGACVTLLSTFYAYSKGIEASYLRFAAVGFDPNDMAVNLCFAVLFATYLLAKTRSMFLRIAYLPLLLLATAAILLSGSRTGFVALAAAASISTLILYQASPRRWRPALGGGILTGLLLLYAILMLVPTQSAARIATLADEIRGGTWNFRLIIWKAGLEVLGENPVLGVGAGGFRLAVNPLVLGELAPHNVFLAVAVEGGVPALLMWIGFLTFSFYKAFQGSAADRWLWIGTSIVLLIASFSLNFEWRKTTWLIATIAAIAGKQHIPGRTNIVT